MSLTEQQVARVQAELASIIPQLARAAPPERQKLIREALERVGVVLTWDEWAALEPAILSGETREWGSGAR